jgi:hypothetical protein
MEKILHLKSKTNNSELFVEKEMVNSSKTNFPHNNLVFKLKNERKNLKDRFNLAYNIILNGQISDEFVVEEGDVNYLTNFLKNKEKEKELLIKQYNTKDRYIQDMLKFDIKSFLNKWFGQRKSNIVKENNSSFNIDELKKLELERYQKLGVNPEKIIFTDVPNFVWSFTKNKIVDYKDIVNLVEVDGGLKLNNENVKIFKVETYNFEGLMQNLDRINQDGIIVYPHTGYWLGVSEYVTTTDFQFTFKPKTK